MHGVFVKVRGTSSLLKAVAPKFIVPLLLQQKNELSSASLLAIGSVLKLRTIPRNLECQHTIVYIQRKDIASYGSCWGTICQPRVRGPNWPGCPITLLAASHIRQHNPFPELKRTQLLIRNFRRRSAYMKAKSQCFNAGCSKSCLCL